jgi:hypothetical protein
MTSGTVECVVPLEAICCASNPLSCATTLDEALSSLSIWCDDPAESDGLLSDCSDGTTELVHTEYMADSDVRIVFDADGNVIGKEHAGSLCGAVYSGTCGGPVNDDATNYQFTIYDGGDTAIRSCEPRCELCENRRLEDETLPRCTTL